VKLTRTQDLLPRVEWLDEAGSTNALLRELVAREGGVVPHGTVLATANQTAGRGRAGRGWQTPPDTAIAMSVLLRPGGAGGDAAVGHGLPLSWSPLLAGSAVVSALQPFFPAELGLRVGVKWPNDVHVRDEADAMAGRPGLKLCGILCELLSDGSIIAGMGVNLLIPDWELPTERATSLLAAGAEVGDAETLADDAGQDLVDRVLSGVAGALLDLADLARSDSDAARRRVLRDSLTLGAEVRVHLPGGEIVDGRARELDGDGALVVDLPTGGQLTVTAADVEHLR